MSVPQMPMRWTRRRTSPAVGAAVIVAMQNYLAQLGAWVLIVQGIIFIICVLLFRRGIVGEIGALFERRARAKPGTMKPSVVNADREIA